jgi:pimeloyl-ACP methyl ester carboxylesterase
MRAFIALCAGLLLASALAAPAFGAPDRSKPIVFVHGFELGAATNCDGTWNAMKRRLDDLGWAGRGGSWDVAFYVGDRGCEHWLNHHGSHRRHFATDGGHTTGAGGNLGHTTDASIRHLGYHLAWFLREHFDRRCVELVGYSMGGLIARYALAQIDRGHAAFPAQGRVCVEDVITLGTPHAGTGWAQICSRVQCIEMRGNLRCNATRTGTSEFIRWLRRNAWDPDGRGGTQWTLVGSQDDLIVDQLCATRNIANFGWVRYQEASNVTHSGAGGYLQRTSRRQTADVVYQKDPAGPVRDRTAPWPVRWADHALRSSRW